MGFVLNVGILFLMPMVTLQLSSPVSLSYTGAVAEYNAVTQITNGVQPADINAKNYVKFIAKAAEYSADILVFPESGLSISTSKDPMVARIEAASYAPDPRDQVLVCGNDTYARSLQTVSCAAREHGLYVVLNHMEKVDCDKKVTANCPADNLLVYNTNVAFDRQGRLIAKYRKYNLYREPEISRTEDGVLSTFETDFGVKFGQFICFDILFEKPALKLIQNLNITDVIFSSQWFSQLPFMYSVMVQAGWSYANDVNFLASGYNDPKTGNGGSGIYIGRKGYSRVVLEDQASNILIVSEIPKVIEGERKLNIDPDKSRVYKFATSDIDNTESNGFKKFIYKTERLDGYSTKLIDAKLGSIDEILCDREFCCEFKLKFSFNENLVNDNSNYYRYRMAVFKGPKNFAGGAAGGVKSCGIIHCVNNTLAGCGRLLDSNDKIPSVTPTTFQFIEITTQNVSKANVFFMPVTLSSAMLPFDVADYTFGSVDFGQHFVHTMSSTKGRNDLLTFAIYARYFATDSRDVTINASSGVRILVCPIILVLVISLFFVDRLNDWQ